MGRDVIIACDFDSKQKTLAFLDKFTGRKPFVPHVRKAPARSPAWLPGLPCGPG